MNVKTPKCKVINMKTTSYKVINTKTTKCKVPFDEDPKKGKEVVVALFEQQA